MAGQVTIRQITVTRWQLGEHRTRALHAVVASLRSAVDRSRPAGVTIQCFDGFALALAGARSVVRSTSRAASPTLSALVLVEIKKLNRHNLPVVKRKILRNAFSHPVKRQYVRKPTPDAPDWLEYLEELTPEERDSYIASFQ